jgi:NAD(P)-dependent dehydrogenase (short-subunit alcohol dehydrogenase family)
VSKQVCVVIGVGGMGQAIARRQAAGRTLLIADVHSGTTESVAAELADEGFDVMPGQVDVGSRESVAELARRAAELGAVTQVVHTAGLSPVQASAADVLKVDLYGVACVLEEFGGVIASRGAGVVIASMAGHLVGSLPADQERALATTPTEELLSLAFLAPDVVTDPGFAYSVAKRANLVRVAAESLKWGRRGARLNSISPGVISTAMGRSELSGPHGAGMRAMVEASGTGRLGTAADIAAAATFLLSDDASFVTGTDLLVDGGVVATIRSA